LVSSAKTKPCQFSSVTSLCRRLSFFFFLFVQNDDEAAIRCLHLTLSYAPRYCFVKLHVSRPCLALCSLLISLLVSPLGNDSFQSGLTVYILLWFNFFSCREISDLRFPIAAKFCIVIVSAFSFKMRVKTFGRLSPQKKAWGQKHAKFGSISDDFKVRRRIFLERIKIFKIGQVHFLPRFLPR